MHGKLAERWRDTEISIGDVEKTSCPMVGIKPTESRRVQPGGGGREDEGRTKRRWNIDRGRSGDTERRERAIAYTVVGGTARNRGKYQGKTERGRGGEEGGREMGSAVTYTYSPELQTDSGQILRIRGARLELIANVWLG